MHLTGMHFLKIGTFIFFNEVIEVYGTHCELLCSTVNMMKIITLGIKRKLISSKYVQGDGCDEKLGMMWCAESERAYNIRSWKHKHRVHTQTTDRQING